MLIPRIHLTGVTMASNPQQIQSPWTTGVTAAQSGNENVYIIHGVARKGTPFTDNATCSGGGLTWTKAYSAIAGNDYHLCFIGRGTVTATAVSITFSGTPTGGRMRSYEVEVKSGKTTFDVDGAEGSGTTGTITRTNPSKSGNPFSAWFHFANENSTPDSDGNWFEFSDTAVASGSFESQYGSGGFDPSHTTTWTTSSVWGGIVVSHEDSVWSATKSSDSYLYPASATHGQGTNPIPADTGDSDAWAILA